MNSFRDSAKYIAWRIPSQLILVQFQATWRRRGAKLWRLRLLVFVALLGLWWGVHVWYRNTLLIELRGDVLAELDPYGNALTIDLRRRFDLIYGFGAWVSYHFLTDGACRTIRHLCPST